MANTDIWGDAKELVGEEIIDDADEITGFIVNNLGLTSDPDFTTTAWSGYFAAAALADAGFAVPTAYSLATNWSGYGQPASTAAVNLVALLAPDAQGYAHVGIVVDMTPTNSPIILCGDVGGAVVMTPLDVTGAVFLTPVSPSASAAASAAAAGLSVASLVPPTTASSVSAAGAAASAATSLLSSLLGGSQQKRQGSQLGNKDTPEKNSARAKSGPMPCGMQHADVTGSPGKFKASSTMSPVSRLPSHEPWTGHPISQGNATASADGSGNSASSGGSSGASGGNPSSGGTGTGGTGSTDAAGANSAPLANPGSFTNNTFNSANNFSVNAPVAVQRFMKDLNLTYSQAVGLVANLAYESAGLVAGKQEGNVTVGKGGLGWAQWTGSRRAEFIAFAKSIGGSVNDPETNYKMVVHDFQGKYKNALAALQQTQSAGDAVLAVERKYEIAGVPAIGGRAAYINKIDSAYKSAVAAGGTPSSTSATSGATTKTAQGQAVSAQQAASQSKTSFQASLAQQASLQQQQPGGTGGSQSPSIPGGSTLNQNKYQPNDPTGQSKDPDQGTDQSSAVGGTPQDSSGSGSGSGGSGDGSSGSAGGSSTTGSTLPNGTNGDIPTPVARPSDGTGDGSNPDGSTGNYSPGGGDTSNNSNGTDATGVGGQTGSQSGGAADAPQYDTSGGNTANNSNGVSAAGSEGAGGTQSGAADVAPATIVPPSPTPAKGVGGAYAGF